MTGVTEPIETGVQPAGQRGMLGETWDALSEVFANRNLRRIQLAFAGSAIGDWAYGTAVRRAEDGCA